MKEYTLVENENSVLNIPADVLINVAFLSLMECAQIKILQQLYYKQKQTHYFDNYILFTP